MSAAAREEEDFWNGPPASAADEKPDNSAAGSADEKPDELSSHSEPVPREIVDRFSPPAITNPEASVLLTDKIYFILSETTGQLTRTVAAYLAKKLRSLTKLNARTTMTSQLEDLFKSNINTKPSTKADCINTQRLRDPHPLRQFKEDLRKLHGKPEIHFGWAFFHIEGDDRVHGLIGAADNTPARVPAADNRGVPVHTKKRHTEERILTGFAAVADEFVATLNCRCVVFTLDKPPCGKDDRNCELLLQSFVLHGANAAAAKYSINQQSTPPVKAQLHTVNVNDRAAGGSVSAAVAADSVAGSTSLSASGRLSSGDAPNGVPSKSPAAKIPEAAKNATTNVMPSTSASDFKCPSVPAGVAAPAADGAGTAAVAAYVATGSEFVPTSVEPRFAAAPAPHAGGTAPLCSANVGLAGGGESNAAAKDVSDTKLATSKPSRVKPPAAGALAAAKHGPPAQAKGKATDTSKWDPPCLRVVAVVHEPHYDSKQYAHNSSKQQKK